MPLLNFKRLSHSSINITATVEEIRLPNSRQMNHGSKTITSGTEDMSLVTSRLDSYKFTY
jgi:hypothetical protein